jgi:hypothetical protein
MKVVLFLPEFLDARARHAYDRGPGFVRGLRRCGYLDKDIGGWHGLSHGVYGGTDKVQLIQSLTTILKNLAPKNHR